MEFRGTLRARAGLGEHARAVGKSISDRGSKLPQYLPQGFFEFLVDQYMLIDAEISRRKILECLYIVVGVFIPIRWQITWPC